MPRILYQTNNERPFCWRGVRRTFLTIYHNTGVTGLWRGHCATLMQVVPKSATTYMTFDRYRQRISMSTDLDNVSIRFLSGALAGATATALTYPHLERLGLLVVDLQVGYDESTDGGPLGYDRVPNEGVLRFSGCREAFRGHLEVKAGFWQDAAISQLLCGL